MDNPSLMNRLQRVIARRGIRQSTADRRERRQVSSEDRRPLESAWLRVIMLFAAVAASTSISACGSINVQPTSVDFNGTDASHGHG